MSPDQLMALKLVAILVVVIGFAVHQLRSVRQSPDESESAKRESNLSAGNAATRNASNTAPAKDASKGETEDGHP